MASGLTARRLILQQLTAVAEHSPFKRAVAAALSTATSNAHTANASETSWWRGILIRPERSRGTFTLMTEEEVAFLRGREESGENESRVILATRPTRHLVRGLGGCALNLTLSVLISPLLALSVALEALRLRGVSRPSTFVLAPLSGLAWGVAFAALAWYAAGQQLVLCVLYKAAGPVLYVRGAGMLWSELSGRYERCGGNIGDAHPMLSTCASEALLRERAMLRETTRRRRADKRNARYSSKGSNGSGEDKDYYAALGIERDATPSQVKEAYNRLVLRVHPDKNPNPAAAAQFDVITKAYRVLSNAERRRKYDAGGTNAVDNLGENNRAALRGVFGGNELCALVGDVKCGAFSYRVIDALDFTPVELAVKHTRMLQSCRDELLCSYLDPIQREQDNVQVFIRQKLHRLVATCLAREVLSAVGQEYMRVVRYSEASGMTDRVRLYACEIFPHRMRRRLEKMRCLSRVRQHTFKDSAAMVDLVWYTSVEDLEATAWWAAASALLDSRLSAEQREGRRNALRTLAEAFTANGNSYTGANKQTMDSLMDSLRKYQQEQQRRRQSS